MVQAWGAGFVYELDRAPTFCFWREQQTIFPHLIHGAFLFLKIILYVTVSNCCVRNINGRDERWLSKVKGATRPAEQQALVLDQRKGQVRGRPTAVAVAAFPVTYCHPQTAP